MFFFFLFLLLFFWLWSPFCSAKQNHFSNFGRGSLTEHFCANTFEIGPLAKDEMSFEDFQFVALAAILFSGVEPLQAILEF